MSTTYTFKSCDGVTGVPNAFLPHISSPQVSIELSDVGAIGFEYLKGGINYSFLEAAFSGPVEVAAFQNGVEMDDCRFRVQSSDDDEVADGETVKFVGVSLVNRLDSAIVYSSDGSVTLGKDQVFNGTPGGILKALFDQNAARGANRVMDQITYASFSNSLDSAGAAWAMTLTDITYTVGLSYLDVLRHMVNNGMIEFKMVGRDLRIYNAGTMGTDRTVQSEPVVLRKGRDLIEAPRTRTTEQIAAVALIAGDDGKLKQVIDSSVGAAWGYDETFISQGGISDDTTLGILAAQEIERRSQVRIQNTHKVALNNSPYTPYVHYKVSDYIYTDRGNGPTRLRIRQMVLEIGAGGVQAASIVLNDKFLEREIMIARRVDGILGGASATGSVAIPAGPDVLDDTTPNTPSSLSSSSSVYVDNGGRAVVAAALSWPASTTNTDSSTLSDLDHYETEYRTSDEDAIIVPGTFAPAREEEDYTRRFDRRWKDYGWIAGEGGASARSDASQDMWLFGSSAVGTARGAGNAYDPSVVLHNSGVVTEPLAPTTFKSLYGRGNKLSANDAFLESTVGNWQADSNCSVARDTLSSWYGTGSLKITATAAGDAVARIAAPGTTNYSVVEGRTYSAMAKVRSSSGTAKNVQIGIRWYNSSNSLVATTLLVSSPGLTTSWVRYTAVDVAPAGATKATLIIRLISAAAGQTFNADTMGLMEGDMSSCSWNDPNRGLSGGPCSMVMPEDMGGSQISAGTLSANQFRADTIFKNGTKIYGMMTRVNAVGTFQSQTALAQWDSTTLAFQDVTQFTTGDAVQWGTTHYINGGFVYLYGYDTTDPDSAQDIVLMRVPSANVFGTKEYISNAGTGTWTTTRASAVPIHVGVNYHFNSITFTGGTYNLLITPKGAKTVRRMTAANLYGPFTDVGIIYLIPNVGGTLYAHSPRIHTQFNNNIGINMSYSLAGQGYLNDVKKFAPKFMLGPAVLQSPLTPLAPWSAPRIIESGATIDNIGGLNPKWNFQARVRAVDSSGHYSIWTESAPIRLEDDTTPPNQPSTPIASPMFKGIRIEWDGQDYQGGPMPSDWQRTEVHISDIDAFLPSNQTLVDIFTTRLGGVAPIVDLDYSATPYYVRFVAVDSRGNKSDPSSVASTTTEQLVNVEDIAKKLIQGANIADGTIATNQLTVAAFEPSVILNGSFEDDATNADGSSTGLPYGWALRWPIGSGSTPSVDIATPIAGGKSLVLTQATAADGARWESVVFPVTEGKLFAASVKVRASRAIANPAFEMHIVCGATVADTGAFPSSTSIWGSSVTAVGTTTVQTMELQRVVDAGMKYARVFITALNSADGSGWVGTFDAVEVRPVGGSAFIADASILNAKIANLAVDNAKIANVNVGKLTAGSLVADITVAARIKTANTGARVELNSSGLQAYNSGGTQTVDIAASTGNAIITGRFQTDFANSTTPHLEMINSGDRTTIVFTDASGVGANNAFINSPLDSANVPRIGINSGRFNYLGIDSKHRLFLNNNDGIGLETYRMDTSGQIGFGLYLTDFGFNVSRVSSANTVTGGTIDMDDTSWNIRRYGGNVLNGGHIGADTSNLFLSATASGSLSTQIILADNQGIWFKGKFKASNPDSGTSALFVDVWSGVNISGGGSVSYGATMATTPRTIFSVHVTTAGSPTPGSLWVSAQSATGFTMTSGNSVTTNAAYWSFRLL